MAEEVNNPKVINNNEVGMKTKREWVGFYFSLFPFIHTNQLLVYLFPAIIFLKIS